MWLRGVVKGMVYVIGWFNCWNNDYIKENVLLFIFNDWMK